jgi:2-polyprenyl-3-methyl-5-hydroxy-6-metoxy-1,4-benzoquinol methylase
MKDDLSKHDINSVQCYMRNMNVFFEGIEGSLLDRAAKKLLAVSSNLAGKRCRPVFSERAVEIPLLFQQIPQSPQNILDFGCAESLLPVQLCAMGHNVTGLDFRPYPFAPKNFRFIQADILAWEPLAETFDFVTSISTIEHVGMGAYGDPHREHGDKIAVDKLRPNLKKGGTMLLTVPAGKKCVRRGMRIYDPEAIESIVPNIEQVRFFSKPTRHSDWEEVSASDIRNLEYERYEAIAPAQGVAFIVSKTT